MMIEDNSITLNDAELVRYDAGQFTPRLEQAAIDAGEWFYELRDSAGNLLATINVNQYACRSDDQVLADLLG